jgi:N-methylhydantoinase B
MTTSGSDPQNNHLVIEDPILLEICRNYLISVCREMGQAMVRTSYSTMFNEAQDFSCAIFDNVGEMVAQGEFCPAHIGAMVHTVEWCIKEVGQENMEPGDVILHNDPYRGGCHLPEHLTLKPVFFDGDIVAYCANIAHMVDVGGTTPAAFGIQRNVFEDGLRIPPVKIYRNDREVEDLVRVMISNVRQPKNTYGDLSAMVGSLYLAERRILDLLARHGKERMFRVYDEIKGVSEVMMRRAIAHLPNGEYPFEGYIEDDGITPDRTWRIAGVLVIRDDSIIVDYTGSDPQSPSSINQSFGCTASATYNATFHLLGGHDIPFNHGTYRPIHIIAPPGTLVNGQYPASVTAGNSDTHPTTIDIVLSALSRVTGVGSAADGGTVGLMGFTGVDPRTNETWVYVHQDGMGWGGRNDHDGNDSQIVKNGNCLNTPIEIYETRYPVFMNEYSLAVGSAGAGAFRGGHGTKREWTMEADVVVSVHSNRYWIHPWGMFGGEEGENTILLFKQHDSDEWLTATEAFGTISLGKFSNILLKKGDRIRLVMPGGGGWGSPFERTVDLVQADIREELLSTAEAREIYGVIVRSDGLVDVDATSKERARPRN